MQKGLYLAKLTFKVSFCSENYTKLSRIRYPKMIIKSYKKLYNYS